jgi:hypothetical protein
MTDLEIGLWAMIAGCVVAIIAVSATIFRQECLSRRNLRRVEGEGKFDDQLNKGRHYHDNQE